MLLSLHYWSGLEKTCTDAWQHHPNLYCWGTMPHCGQLHAGKNFTFQHSCMEPMINVWQYERNVKCGFGRLEEAQSTDRWSVLVLNQTWEPFVSNTCCHQPTPPLLKAQMLTQLIPNSHGWLAEISWKPTQGNFCSSMPETRPGP